MDFPTCWDDPTCHPNSLLQVGLNAKYSKHFLSSLPSIINLINQELGQVSFPIHQCLLADMENTYFHFQLVTVPNLPHLSMYLPLIGHPEGILHFRAQHPSAVPPAAVYRNKSTPATRQPSQLREFSWPPVSSMSQYQHSSSLHIIPRPDQDRLQSVPPWKDNVMFEWPYVT